MKVSFQTNAIAETCQLTKAASRVLGAAGAKKLQRRLSELFNARVVGELVAGRPHPLKGDQLGRLALDLHGGWRLVIEPTLPSPPRHADGSIDWSLVDAITIVEIGDYHG